MIHDLLTYGAGIATAFLLSGLFHRSQPAAEIDECGHWCFPVDTFAQMLDIPVERRERFLAELPLVLTRIWEMRDKFPLATLPGAVWVDDGLGELRPNIINAPKGSGDAFAFRPLDGNAA